MKRIGSFLWAALLLAGCLFRPEISGGQDAAQRSAAQAPSKAKPATPVTMTECEGVNNCATWTFLGAQGNGQWPSGEVANLSVERYDNDSVVIRRADSTGSSAGLTAVYTGTRHGDRVGGEFTSSWPGHWDNKAGNWYATVERSPQGAAKQHIEVRGVVSVDGMGDSPLRDAAWSGTKGQGRGLEGFSVSLASPVQGLGLEYTCHIQGLGDQAWMRGGSFCGTRGQSRRIEGFAIRLTGPRASQYDIVYSCHLQGFGDAGPVKNGAFCGTKGQSRRLEAMQVWVTSGNGEPGQPLPQRAVIAVRPGPVVCFPWFFGVVCE